MVVLVAVEGSSRSMNVGVWRDVRGCMSVCTEFKVHGSHARYDLGCLAIRHETVLRVAPHYSFICRRMQVVSSQLVKRAYGQVRLEVKEAHHRGDAQLSPVRG